MAVSSSSSIFNGPGFYILILSIINLMSFMDRGIIPGATDEFTNFIDDTIHTSTPSLYIGLLQSSFIIGISLSSPIFATLAHHKTPFLLIAWGMLGWTIAACLCGSAIILKNYELLILGRILSGVGEASFVCCTAPWIVLNAPPQSKSSWLALFYTTTPVGTAFGYIYSSVISNAIGVKWAFFIEAIYMIPFLGFLFFMAKKFPLLPPGMSHFPLNKEEETVKEPLLTNTDDNISPTSSDEETDHIPPPTIWEETVVVCSYPCFVYMTLGYSALTGTLIGLATFGSSFFLALGYFDSEVAASSVFGILVSVAGIIGFPIGGLLIDVLSKHHHKTLSTTPEGNTAIFIETPNENLRDDDDDDDDDVDEEDNSPFPRTISYTNPTESINQEHGHHHHHHHSSSNNQNKNDINHNNDYFSMKNLTDLYSSSYVMTISSIFGMILMCSAYFAHNVISAIFVLFLGTIFLLMCNSAATIGVVYSVPIQHRPFGLAFNLIGMHMLGDVPSPLIAGYLKDTLAPGCVGNDDEVSTSHDCRDDAHGIRITMLIISLWLVWCGVFFGLSAYHAKKSLKRLVEYESPINPPLIK